MVDPEDAEVARAATAPSAPVVACGVMRVSVKDVPALRKTPGPPGSPRVPPSMLKHADEQTVIGLSAVLHAMVDRGMESHDFRDWGVIGSPRYLARVQGAVHIDRYRRQGVAAVSPLIIPYLSLHSMSGTISLAIGARGTNFGVGGAHGHVPEGLLSALITRLDMREGLWLVMTGWDPEPVPDLEQRTSAVETTGYAVVLAVAGPSCSMEAIGSIRLNPAAPHLASEDESQEPELTQLASFLAGSFARSPRWSVPVVGGALELQWNGAPGVHEAKAG